MDQEQKQNPEKVVKQEPKEDLVKKEKDLDGKIKTLKRILAKQKQLAKLEKDVQSLISKK